MRGKAWKRQPTVPLHWEWVTAEQPATCSALLCRQPIAVGDHIICVEEQHEEGRPFKTRYWCTACSPDKAKRLDSEP